MADKTESPTSSRIHDARERGQVARSIELNAAAGLVAGIWLLSGPGKNLVSGLSDLIRFTATNLPTDEITGIWLKERLYLDFSFFVNPLAEIILVMLIIGVGTTLIQ
ncbi:MAG TPA: EscU/YscU/HrcU family type III secretion system export apparatus switch protein, partial [Leptolinea sp.]